MNEKEKREQIVAKMITLAAKLAFEDGYTSDTVDPEGSNLWGKGFAEYLANKYGGDCSKEINWFNPTHPLPENGWGDNYSFGFHFADPSICFDQRKVDGSLVEIVLSNYNHDTKEFDGKWHISQVNVFNEKMDLANKMVKLVKKEVLGE